jgi:hypothetical protein
MYVTAQHGDLASAARTEHLNVDGLPVVPPVVSPSPAPLARELTGDWLLIGSSGSTKHLCGRLVRHRLE